MLLQMATVRNVTINDDGKLVTNGLHESGFTVLLWKTLQDLGCADPPTYVGQQLEYPVEGVDKWETSMTIPFNPKQEE